MLLYVPDSHRLDHENIYRRTENGSQWTPQGEVLDEVQSFKYLGSIVDTNGGRYSDIRSRIWKTKAAFIVLNTISCLIRYPQKFKNQPSYVFQTQMFRLCLCIETWRSTNSLLEKIQTFVNKCLRRILRIRWPEIISNETLW